MSMKDFLYGVGFFLFGVSLALPNFWLRLLCFIDGWMMMVVQYILEENMKGGKKK